MFTATSNKRASSCTSTTPHFDVKLYINNMKRLLSCTAYLEFKKAPQEPLLSEMNNQKHLQNVTKHVTWKIADWNGLLFCDENLFYFVGHDGIHSSWHDPRREPNVLARREVGDDRW